MCRAIAYYKPETMIGRFFSTTPATTQGIFGSTGNSSSLPMRRGIHELVREEWFD